MAVMERNEVIRKLKDICNMYPDILGLVILFGSYSRGDASEKSDIDLYVEPLDRSITSARFWANKRYKDFEYSLYDNFPYDFDLLSYGGKRDLKTIRKTPLWTQILKDGVLWTSNESFIMYDSKFFRKISEK